MRLLLDTQLAFWWHRGDPSLTIETRRLVGSSDEPVYVSRVSLWEVAIKAGVGKLRIDLPAFAADVEALGFSWLPIENAHILGLASLPSFPDHRDPFDRLLIAQSATEPLVLVTADAKLTRYGPLVRLV